jgi:hypothetical protein
MGWCLGPSNFFAADFTDQRGSSSDSGLAKEGRDPSTGPRLALLVAAWLRMTFLLQGCSVYWWMTACSFKSIVILGGRSSVLWMRQ